MFWAAFPWRTMSDRNDDSAPSVLLIVLGAQSPHSSHSLTASSMTSKVLSLRSRQLPERRPQALDEVVLVAVAGALGDGPLAFEPRREHHLEGLAGGDPLAGVGRGDHRRAVLVGVARRCE